MNRRQLLAYGSSGMAAAALPAGHPRARGQAAGLDAVETIVIHPAIGIARVGNSPEGWFLGPEAPGPHPVPPGGFKDEAGRIKRQAARFRLYGLDRDGQVVGEVTAADADVRWTVHLANAKAAWYDFDVALDIPSARGLPAAPLQEAPPPTQSARRNASIVDRGSLRNDPGPRSVSGADANVDGQSPEARFEGGRVFGIDVPLGDLAGPVNAPMPEPES